MCVDYNVYQVKFFWIPCWTGPGVKIIQTKFKVAKVNVHLTRRQKWNGQGVMFQVPKL